VIVAPLVCCLRALIESRTHLPWWVLRLCVRVDPPGSSLHRAHAS
jgi:hypothetical protein